MKLRTFAAFLLVRAIFFANTASGKATWLTACLNQGCKLGFCEFGISGVVGIQLFRAIHVIRGSFLNPKFGILYSQSVGNPAWIMILPNGSDSMLFFSAELALWLKNGVLFFSSLQKKKERPGMQNKKETAEAKSPARCCMPRIDRFTPLDGWVHSTDWRRATDNK